MLTVTASGRLGQPSLRWVRIPSVLGFGSNGAGNVIPPGADLVFSIELLAELPKR